MALDMRLLELLAALEERLRAVGDPMVGVLRPGLPEGIVIGTLRDAGLGAPREVLTWFAWHDGAESSTRGEAVSLLRAGWPLPLHEALARRREWRDAIAVDAVTVSREDEPDRTLEWYWDPQWLPIFMPRHGAITVVNCSDAILAPPHSVEYEDAEGDFRLSRAPDLGTVIEAWLRFIGTDLLRWNPQSHRWILGDRWPQRLPGDAQLLL